MSAPMGGRPPQVEWRWLFHLSRVLSLLRVEFIERPPLSWQEDGLIGSESCDGNERECKTEGYEEVFNPQTPLTPSEKDLQWVPPWPPRWLDDSTNWIPLSSNTRPRLMEDLRGERRGCPIDGSRSVAGMWRTGHQSFKITQSRAMDSEGFSTSRFSGEGKRKKNQRISGRWCFTLTQRQSKVSEQPQ